MTTQNTEPKQNPGMLVPLNVYLSSGIHIGMKQRLKAMEQYVYKVRPDKLAVFDISKIDNKIRSAGRFLANYAPEEILVVSRKRNGHKPVDAFKKAVPESKGVWGRFMPGTLTNPNYKNYIEPKVVVITDPFADKQAILEAYNANIPIIAMCDTFNDPRYVDLIIPMNNKGKKSVALVFWILAREYLKEKGMIKGDAEMKQTLEDFEMPDNR